MDIKFIFFLVAFILVLTAYVPYFRGILARTTTPHAYTWLIWTITTGIGAAGVWYGGGGLPAVSFAIASFLSFLIFLLSLKYGTRNITVGDTFTLLAALFAIFVWVQLQSPLWSVIIGVSIDMIGYWPSIRKTYIEPWSESLSAWVLWIFAPFFSLLALDAYNPLTVLYYAPIVVVNIFFVLMFLIRRKSIPKPPSIQS